MDDVLDLGREELREIGTRVHEAAGSPTEPFGIYALSWDSPDSKLARWVESSVFGEFFGNSPEMLAREYAPYEQASVLLCALDHHRKLPAGMMRLLLPSECGFKTLDDIERVWGRPIDEVLRATNPEFDRDHLMDVATIAVAPDYRREATDGLVSLSLYQALGYVARWRDLRWIVTVLDTNALELVQEATLDAFAPFAGVEAREYLDSPASLPVWCDLDAYFRRIEVTDPVAYELFAEGRGLEAAVRPLQRSEAPAMAR
ncbi:MAG TPA: hypothetical protein VIC35_08920 [Acidimicrobiia bacterium]|jgi:hypothetical protein